jgi:Zn-dependent M16 (insulinase) family peptidase
MCPLHLLQASNAFTNQALKGCPKDWSAQLLEKFQTVSKADVLAALEKYFLPLFDASTSVAHVVTAPGKADSIAEALTAIGFDVEKRTLEVDPDEMEEDGSESGSDDSGSEMDTDSEDERR